MGAFGALFAMLRGHLGVEGAGKSEHVDGFCTGLTQKCGAGIAGCTSGDDVVDKEDGFACKVFGARCAIGGFGVGKAFGTVQARLGNLAGANAFEGACGARQVEFAGKGFGKEFGLVVTARTQFGRLHGHGNKKVDRNARICNAELVGGDEVANQIVGEPDAFSIFKGLDEVAKGVVVTCHNEGAFKGGGLLKAFRTGKVVAFGECRFGSAADAGGVAME